MSRTMPSAQPEYIIAESRRLIKRLQRIIKQAEERIEMRKFAHTLARKHPMKPRAKRRERGAKP